MAERFGVARDDLLSADLMTHDLTPSCLIGVDEDLVSAPRLDNQGTCYAGLEALLAAQPGDYLPVLALFDHEGGRSTSDHGAQSDFLPTTLERIVVAGAGTGGLPAAADGVDGRVRGHGARHPPELSRRHEPGHLIAVNGGPVLKVQPNLRAPPTAAPPPRSPSPAARPACRCSATNTGPICRAGPLSGR